jgi:hypothetical protein
MRSGNSFRDSFRELPSSLKKCALGFAAAGSVVAVTLGAYAFYLTSHQRIGNELLFIVLCPPSIGALALDSADVAGGLVGWSFIVVANSVLYGAAGFGLGSLWEGTKRTQGKRSNSEYR